MKAPAVDLTQALLLVLPMVVLVLLYADYRQTLGIKSRPDLHEINPILGKQPTDEAVRLYFRVCAALFMGMLVIALLLGWPLWLRFVWIAGWGAVECWAVRNNRRLGL